MAPRPTVKFVIGLIYLCGIMQGLALVAFPAFSAIFVSPSEFALTGAQYGGMFIPQVTLAILASALSPWLARRLGLRGVLLLGLGGDLLSMALLSASPLLIGSPAAYVALCASTGALGFGFGATVMTLNTVVEGLFPGRADGAVLTLNALLGLGTALAPLLVALFTALGAWWTLPLLIALFAALLFGAFATSTSSLGAAPETSGESGSLPARFWLYASAALLYGIVETLSGNWATLYLSGERHISARDASFALTAFWLMITLGRVGLALLAKWLPAKWAYAAMPVCLALVFQGVARADGAAAAVVAFAAAGLFCSGMLPLSVSFSGQEFPSRSATMSGEMIAFYQVGVGVAAFGVGPLHARGLAYSATFSFGGLFALALGIVAWLVVAWRPRGP